MSDVFWCSTCLNMSTRPRITFDSHGRCNACQWAEEKKTLDWSVRQKELNEVLNHHRSKDGSFDCVVPVSGGKDGSYVAYQLKHNYGMHPLTVTVTPALSLELGNQNLKNFIASGFDHIQVSAAGDVLRTLNKFGFIHKGFPYFGWLIAIETVPLKIAAKFNLSLIFYGEEGETEYGGSTALKNVAFHDINFMRDVYLEGGQDLVFKEAGLTDDALVFFRFPTQSEVGDNQLKITHWSYFENWDPYRNFLLAKEKCGLVESPNTNSGTFTNFAQNDQALYSLHAYMMYLKFGFGRATQDAGIEIRRGAMDRDQAINLVRLFDGKYPEEFIGLYLDYYQMSQHEFDATIERWVNKGLFELKNGRWLPTFSIR